MAQRLYLILWNLTYTSFWFQLEEVAHMFGTEGPQDPWACDARSAFNRSMEAQSNTKGEQSIQYHLQIQATIHTSRMIVTSATSIIENIQTRKLTKGSDHVTPIFLFVEFKIWRFCMNPL